MTRLQARLLAFLKAQEAEGVTPSFEEMRTFLGLSSKSGIHRLLTSLQEQGKIQREYAKARRITVLPDRVAVSTVSTGQLIAELMERGFVIVPRAMLESVA